MGGRPVKPDGNPASALVVMPVMVPLSVLDLATVAAGSTPARALEETTEGASHLFSTGDRAVVEEAMATHVIGEPEEVREGLVELQRRAHADEIMLSTRTHSYEARARSLRSRT
jgi:alkanesulfonate monooxygenase SsuD/methylene tetrahydromethanopterin reductase-like flavin-dependent oxidoreductase (luciferase family)